MTRAIDLQRRRALQASGAAGTLGPSLGVMARYVARTAGGPLAR